MNVPVTVEGVTTSVQMITAADVQREFRYTFGKRVWLDPYAEEETEDINAAAQRFKSIWNAWSLRRADAYGRMLSAMKAEALTDPVENYDRMEEGGWKDTNTIGERESNTDTTPAVVNTSEQFIAGDDSATPVLASKNVVTPGGQTDNVKNTSEEATDTTEREYQDYRVHGNIGVSTAADMAEKILLLHAKDLVKMALDEFIDLYTVYYGGR